MDKARFSAGIAVAIIAAYGSTCLVEKSYAVQVSADRFYNRFSESNIYFVASTDAEQKRATTYIRIKDQISSALKNTNDSNSLRKTVIQIQSEVNDNTTGLTDEDRDDLGGKMKALQAKLNEKDQEQEKKNAATAPISKSSQQSASQLDPVSSNMFASDCASARDAAQDVHQQFLAAQSAEKSARRFSAEELTVNPDPLCKYYGEIERLWQQALEAAQSCPDTSNFRKMAKGFAIGVTQARQQESAISCSQE